MKVLFAIDGSDGSFAAVAQVSPLLVLGRDEITLYCSPPRMHLESSAVAAELVPAAQAALADAIFAEATRHLPAPWRSAAVLLVGTNEARRGILAAAEQMHTELIVVGARGLNRFERLLLGSVSRAVVHGSHVPVWIARPKSPASSPGFRILLVCETLDSARLPARLLNCLNWPAGTTCCAMTVIESIFAGQVPDWLEQQARSPDVEELARRWAQEHEQELQRAGAQMEALVKGLPKGFSNPRPLVAQGEPTEQILAAVGREHANLVVIGTKPRHHRAAAMFGSTSEAVLNHAGCSVLVVPHQESP